MANWSKDNRPARKRYWDKHTLEKRKIRNILANKQRHHDKEGHAGKRMTEREALIWWQSRRQGRVPDKYIPIDRT